MIRIGFAVRLLAAVGLLAFTALTPESSSASNNCSCSYCKAHPSEECQMGPGDGLTMLCGDYLGLNHC